MTDEAVRALARCWRGAVRRGDCSASHARLACASEATYPYASSERWAAVMAIATQVIR